MKQSLQPAPARRKRAAAKPSPLKRLAKKATPAPAGNWLPGIALSTGGAQHYRLYKPPALGSAERLPLVVMLHGCSQNAEKLAVTSQMNRLAARERFMVLYPEQDRLSNALGCWNWYDTRSGRAQGESAAINSTISQICRQQPVDQQRIALAGFSAGAGMAVLLASRHPERFCAIAMHSGIAPGVAHSSATALSAMRGRRSAMPLPPTAAGVRLPGLLVIQGGADHVVAPANAPLATRLWAAQSGAKPGKPRLVQRGARYAATITDYKTRGRLIATLCEVSGLGHAWSGGRAGQEFSDPRGPNAANMIWSFVVKQFAATAD